MSHTTQDIIDFLPIEDLTPTFCVTSLSEIYDWGLMMTGIPVAQQFTQGEGITVAVLDTGGPHHPDLNDNLLTALNATGMPTADDHQGHGTHVAGIVAALHNGMGVIGVAPKAKILPIKVLNDNGQSGYNEIERGIRMAIAAKVDIISMSLGAPFAPPQSIHDAIIDATNAGIIILAAAGNDAGAVNYPARFPEVIAVAAIDQNGNLAQFSSRGDQVAVGAPGVAIYSTYLNQKYALLSGTSQACPLMAGVCALILSYSRANPTTMRQIHNYKDMLDCLDDVCDPVGRVGVHGKDGNLGFGIPSFANIPWRKPETMRALGVEGPGDSLMVHPPSTPLPVAPTPLMLAALGPLVMWLYRILNKLALLYPWL